MSTMRNRKNKSGAHQRERARREAGEARRAESGYADRIAGAVERRKQEQPMIFEVNVSRDWTVGDTTHPWGAWVFAPQNESEEQSYERVTGDTLVELHRSIIVMSEDISDKHSRPVGIVWTYNGDPQRWIEIARQHDLDTYQSNRTITGIRE